jgi:hypothetical protein
MRGTPFTAVHPTHAFSSGGLLAWLVREAITVYLVLSRLWEQLRHSMLCVLRRCLATSPTQHTCHHDWLSALHLVIWWSAVGCGRLLQLWRAAGLHLCWLGLTCSQPVDTYGPQVVKGIALLTRLQLPPCSSDRKLYLCPAVIWGLDCLWALLHTLVAVASMLLGCCTCHVLQSKSYNSSWPGCAAGAIDCLSTEMIL